MSSKNKYRNKTNIAFRFSFREIVREDATLPDKCLYWCILMVFICQYIMLFSFSIVGFEELGSFGPVSDTLGLGLTKPGLIVELVFTAFITFVFVAVLKEKIRYISGK